MGPLLFSHGAVASPRAEVESAGGRRDEVPDGPGGPHGGGESGPRSASGEAGVSVRAHAAPATRSSTFQFEPGLEHES